MKLLEVRDYIALNLLSDILRCLICRNSVGLGPGIQTRHLLKRNLAPVVSTQLRGSAMYLSSRIWRDWLRPAGVADTGNEARSDRHSGLRFELSTLTKLVRQMLSSNLLIARAHHHRAAVLAAILCV